MSRVGKLALRKKLGVYHLHAFLHLDYFSHFWRSNGHALYETPIGKWVFRLKQKIKQIRTSSGSWQWFSLFLSILAKIVGYFSHFCSFKGYVLYETLIGKLVLWIKWGVKHLRTTSGSRDIKFCLFQPFSAKKAISAISVGLMVIHYMKHL